LKRSGIGLPSAKLQTLEALGLKKRFQTTYKPVNPQIAGQLLRVKELLDLQLVEEPVSKEEMREARRPPRGYIVESVPKRD
jgi:large subunit ribosomal protein L30